MKPPRWFFWMLGVLDIALCLNIHAAPFVVILKLQGRTTSQCITNPPALNQAVPKVRPVLGAGIDEPLKVHFHIMQTGGTEAQNAVVHLYIALEESLNQMRAPDLKSDQVILESALSASFKAGQSAQGTFSFRISRPGLYLVRVEGLDIEPAGIETPFAALDLAIEGKAAK
jgi:hypothetical protein